MGGGGEGGKKEDLGKENKEKENIRSVKDKREDLKV
jgi:hypothetical protein